VEAHTTSIKTTGTGGHKVAISPTLEVIGGGIAILRNTMVIILIHTMDEVMQIPISKDSTITMVDIMDETETGLPRDRVISIRIADSTILETIGIPGGLVQVIRMSIIQDTTDYSCHKTCCEYCERLQSVHLYLNIRLF